MAPRELGQVKIQRIDPLRIVGDGPVHRHGGAVIALEVVADPAAYGRGRRYMTDIPSKAAPGPFALPHERGSVTSAPDEGSNVCLALTYYRPGP